MPRRPKAPNYFASRGGYYIQLCRVQHLLAKGDEHDPAVKDEAWRNFHLLMNAANVTADGDNATVKALCNSHLDWVAANRSQATYRQKLLFLSSFAKNCGGLRVREVRRFHVEEWLTRKATLWRDKRRKKWERWGHTTRGMAADCVVGLFNWGVKQGILSVNPLAGYEKPAKVSRSMYCVVRDAHHRLIVEAADVRSNKGFVHFLQALFETGARPGEVLAIEAKHYNPSLKAWVIDARPDIEGRGNNKLGYQGKRRVIYLNDKMVALVETLNREHPTGPIFPGDRQAGFLAEVVAANRFRRYRNEVNRQAEAAGQPPPIPAQVTLYGYRHRFATDWLEAGKPVAYLAEVLGTSIHMIQRNYSHLAEQSAAIREQLLDFRRPRANGDASS